MEEEAWLRFWATFGGAVLLPAVAGAIFGWVRARRHGRGLDRAVGAALAGLALGLAVGFVCAPFIVSVLLR